MLSYFSTTPANEWVFQDVFELYKIKYRDNTTAATNLKEDLKIINKNVNILKTAQTKAKTWLDNYHKLCKTCRTSSINPPSNTSIFNTNTANQIIINQNVEQGPSHSDAGNKKRRLDESEVMEQAHSVLDTDADKSEPVMLKEGEIKAILPSKPFFISSQNSESINISAKFYEFQKSAITLANESGLILETHPHHVLALSSVLLIKPSQHHTDLLKFFKIEELKLLRNNVLSKLAGKDYEDIEFNQDIFIQVRKIIKGFLKSSGDSITSTKELALLLDTNHTFESKILLSLIMYMNSLPEVKFIEPLGEIEVCINLLHPLLSPLFYDKDNSFLRWCNKITEEAKESRTNVNKSRRPDAIISTILQNHVGCNKGFGEVKVIEGLKNKYGLVKDLVRLSTFSKESIDLNNMKCNISFQAIGGHIFFYAHTLLADGLYAMVELCDVVAPSCSSDLLSFLSELDKLKLVYNIFVSSCKQLDTVETSWKRHTLDSPTFSQYVSKDSGKQPSHLSFD